MVILYAFVLSPVARALALAGALLVRGCLGLVALAGIGWLGRIVALGALALEVAALACKPIRVPRC